MAQVGSKNLTLTIIDSDNVIYDSAVKSVSSYNSHGIFDILPFHSNFITLITKKIIINDLTGQKKEILIDEGIMRVKRNSVQIFLGIEKVKFF